MWKIWSEPQLFVMFKFYAACQLVTCLRAFHLTLNIDWLRWAYALSKYSVQKKRKKNFFRYAWWYRNEQIFKTKSIHKPFYVRNSFNNTRSTFLYNVWKYSFIFENFFTLSYVLFRYIFFVLRNASLVIKVIYLKSFF